MEFRIPDIVKAVSWFFLITVGPSVIIWLLTGEVKIAVIVGLIDVVMQLVIFFAGKRNIPSNKKTDIKN